MRTSSPDAMHEASLRLGPLWEETVGSRGNGSRDRAVFIGGRATACHPRSERAKEMRAKEESRPISSPKSKEASEQNP